MKQIYKIINKLVDEEYVLNYRFRNRNAGLIVCFEDDVFKIARIEGCMVLQDQKFDDAEDFKPILEEIIFEVFEDRMLVK